MESAVVEIFVAELLLSWCCLKESRSGRVEAKVGDQVLAEPSGVRKGVGVRLWCVVV